MKLPIDIVPGSCPTRFKWKQIVDIPVDAGAPEDRRYVEVVQPLPVAIEKPVAELIKICKDLYKFKDWIQAYLDSRSVPGDTISDRMDWVWAEMERLREQINKIESVEDTYDAATRGQVRGRKSK